MVYDMTTNENREQILAFRKKQAIIAVSLQNLVLAMINNESGTADDFYALTQAIHATVQTCNASDCLYDEDVY